MRRTNYTSDKNYLLTIRYNLKGLAYLMDLAESTKFIIKTSALIDYLILYCVIYLCYRLSEKYRVTTICNTPCKLTSDERGVVYGPKAWLFHKKSKLRCWLLVPLHSDFKSAVLYVVFNKTPKPWGSGTALESRYKSYIFIRKFTRESFLMFLKTQVAVLFYLFTHPMSAVFSPVMFFHSNFEFVIVQPALL